MESKNAARKNMQAEEGEDGELREMFEHDRQYVP